MIVLLVLLACDDTPSKSKPCTEEAVTTKQLLHMTCEPGGWVERDGDLVICRCPKR